MAYMCSHVWYKHGNKGMILCVSWNRWFCSFLVVFPALWFKIKCCMYNNFNYSVPKFYLNWSNHNDNYFFSMRFVLHLFFVIFSISWCIHPCVRRHTVVWHCLMIPNFWCMVLYVCFPSSDDLLLVSSYTGYCEYLSPYSALSF